ncbi:MAG: sigma-54-dependent transcriptional regulator [Thermodesulfobacteriota bacterium]
MSRQRILLVDDETDLLVGLKRMLAREFTGVEIFMETNGIKALELTGTQRFDLILIDIQMPEINGLSLLRRMLAIDPALTIIIMTGYGTIEIAVEAMKSGAYDFITKPFDRTSLFRVIGKGLELNRLLRENIRLRQCISEQQPFADFVGQSRPMQRLYHGIRTTAATDYTVLIRGESGTGKELTARAIHSLSSRRERPMVMVNCPTIPEQLLESELFGYRKGAFTGADRDREGLLVQADGSTICLDEIGDIPVSVQTKLLRFLQEREIRPVGGAGTRSVDLRIIASTNADLEKKIKDHSFREDLYYRLNVVTLRTPPLREIREDIPLLVDHFTRLVCSELGWPEKRFSLEALEALVNKEWPGNVRELQNVVRSAVLFCPEETVGIRYLRNQRAGEAVGPGRENAADRGQEVELYREAKDRVITDFTKEYVVGLLESTGGNVSKAAELSGLTRAALQKIMRRHEIVSQNFRPD